MEKAQNPLSAKAFETAANETDAVILDVRHQSEYVMGHVPRSIFIGIEGDFAPWVGALIADVKQPILLVTPVGHEEEVITRLARVGFDNTIGYLEGGFDSWKSAGMDYDTITYISAEEFKDILDKENIPVFDVRRDGEYKSEHVENAKHTPLGTINKYLSDFPVDRDFYVHCAAGYRSVIASSILKSRGIHNIIDVKGGFDDIKKAGVRITDYICPTTL
jgi:rhodanese-related sulfurtransferase